MNCLCGSYSYRHQSANKYFITDSAVKWKTVKKSSRCEIIRRYEEREDDRSGNSHTAMKQTLTRRDGRAQRDVKLVPAANAEVNVNTP